MEYFVCTVLLLLEAFVCPPFHPPPPLPPPLSPPSPKTKTGEKKKKKTKRRKKTPPNPEPLNTDANCQNLRLAVRRGKCSRQKQISLKIIPIINVWTDYLKTLNLLLFALRAMHWNSLCSLQSLQWKVSFFYSEKFLCRTQTSNSLYLTSHVVYSSKSL